jgi:glycosyltransferase involved in cell wall biosynthesis
VTRVEDRTPRRVLHVVRPAAGGMKAHVLQLAAGLGAYGFECHIACPGEADIVQPALAAGVEVKPVPIVGPLRPLRDLEAVLVVMDIVRHGRYEIVHSHGAKAGLIGRLGAMLGGCRLRVVTIHNDVIGGSLGPRMRTAYSAAERWLARHTARIIAVSDALRDQALEALELDASAVVTVHNGLDISQYGALADPGPARERLGVPRGALVFGTVARFAPQKALDVLVAAAVPVLERIENAWLVVAGDGPLLDAVRRQASLSSVADRIVFPGYITDVPGLLAALDVFVSSSSSEGMGIAIVEAMAAGLPVVATAVGGVPEVVVDRETGLLVAAGDTGALGDAMARLGNDASLRISCGEAGRRRAVAEFGEDAMLERTAEIYREVLCSRSSK